MNSIEPINGQCIRHIDTSHLICSANFYMMETLAGHNLHYSSVRISKLKFFLFYFVFYVNQDQKIRRVKVSEGRTYSVNSLFILFKVPFKTWDISYWKKHFLQLILYFFFFYKYFFLLWPFHFELLIFMSFLLQLEHFFSPYRVNEFL